jgi:hypothetical protein
VTDNAVGDWASIVGVIISLLGFWIAIQQIRRSKTAAQRAEEAAKETRKSIHLFDTFIDFFSAITLFDEIKRLHRLKEWPLLPDRYAALRKLLVSARASKGSLTEVQATALQRALVNLQTMETEVEKEIHNQSDPNPVRLNKLILMDADNLVEILTQLRSGA